MGPQGTESPQPEEEGGRRRRPILRYVLLGALALLLLSFGGLYQYSTSPQFCRSCHIMEPYYKAWATSRHNFVACVDCHYPPGTRDQLRAKFQSIAQVAKFVTRTYSSKPFAEVEDASCLRSGCHATRLLEGQLLYKGFVRFNHREHLSERRAGKKLRCTSCHSQIVVGTHMVVTETTCFLCHFKGRQTVRELDRLAGCDTCHSAPDRAIRVGDITYNHKDFVGARHVVCQNCHLDTIRGEGDAPRDRCFDCHNKPEHLARYGETKWLHDQHVTGHNIECSRCHKPIEHSIPRVSASKPRQVACETCHKAEHDVQQLMFLGVGGRGVPTQPSPMFLARVDCPACHIQPRFHPGGATLFHASERTCVKCHSERYRGMVAEWKAAFKKALDEFRPKVRAAGKALSKAVDNPNRTLARALFLDVLQNVKMVEQGSPVHNIYYAARLLQAANEKIDQMGALLPFKPQPMARNSLVSGGYCATLCHDRVEVKLPEWVTWQDIRMPHERHFTSLQIGCANCHYLPQHKEVSMKMDRGECLLCHHQVLRQAPQTPCGACHSRQVAFRKGQSLKETKAIPGSMASLPCRSCHVQIDKGHREADVRASCKMCHKAGYEASVDAWKQEVSEKRGKIEERLRILTRRVRAARQEVQKRAMKGLVEVRQLLQAIALDQSGGFHNHPYALELVRRARQRLWEAENVLGLTIPAG